MPGAACEELDCGVVGGRRGLIGGGIGQALDLDDPLGLELEPRARGDDDTQGGGAGQQPGHRLHISGRQDVLEVIQDKEDIAAAQVADQRRPWVVGMDGGNLQRLHHGRDDVGAVVHRRQPDKAHAGQVIVDALGGRLQRKPRLADAAGTGQRDEAHDRVGQQAAQGAQFRRAPHELVDRRVQVVARPVQRGLDLCGQFGGFVRRLDIEDLTHDAPALLELRQRRAALARARQRQHQLAVRLFAPRVEGQQTRGAVDGLGKAPFRHLQADEVVQRVEHQLAQPRPLRHEPLLEVRRVTQHHPFEQVAAIQRGRFGQRGDAFFRRQPGRQANAAYKLGHVEPAVCVRPQRRAVARDLQKRVAGLAQVGESLAQIVLGIGVAHLAPEERRQQVTLDGPLHNGEIGQQRRHLDGDESGQRRAIQPDFHASQKQEFQPGCHPVRSSK